MTGREQRFARNEALFRDLNERVKEISATLAPVNRDDEHILELFCECGAADCMERIGVPVEVYEQVRAKPERFLVAPGHDARDVEDIIEELQDYWIVEKHEEEAKIARATDPRS